MYGGKCCIFDIENAIMLMFIIYNNAFIEKNLNVIL